jgi:hypothetical protein
MSWAQSRAGDDIDKVVELASTEKSQSLVSYSETANAFGKVLHVIGDYIDQFKPAELSFNNASSGLGKLYGRALRAKSVQEFFRSHSYSFDISGDEAVDGFGKLTTFTLTRI